MNTSQPPRLQIAGEGKPNIKGPKGRYFAKTTLPWMSIGYKTQIPPTNIPTFYNAIIDNDIMVCPKFVKAATKDGKIVKGYSTETINPRICSERILKQIQEVLYKVVHEGLVAPAGPKQFAISGKTDTAQISQGAAGYTSGGVSYLVSFCGHFPSEAPKYNCIVSTQKPNPPTSRGLMTDNVSSKIAERVYTRDLRLDIRNTIDTNTVVIPGVKVGEMTEARQILERLNIQTQAEPKIKKSREVWGRAQAVPRAVILQGKKQLRDLVPSIIDMGAKDAVYLLESKGLEVALSGINRARSQSLPQGTTIKKGQTIGIHLN